MDLISTELRQCRTSTSVHQNIPRGAGELRPKPPGSARHKPGTEGRDLAVWSLPVVPNQARARASVRTWGQGWFFRWVYGWRTTADAPGELCHAVRCKPIKGDISHPKRPGGAGGKITPSRGFTSSALQGTALSPQGEINFFPMPKSH